MAKGFFPDNIPQIIDIVEKIFRVELAHKLWLDNFIETCQINYVASIIHSEPESTKQKIFSRCSADDFEHLFEPFKKKIIEKTNLKSITDKEFEDILKTSKIFFPDNYAQIVDIVENNISVELAHSFWLDGFIENCPIDYVARTILSAPDQLKGNFQQMFRRK
ncbi:MAG: hypothetical protein IPG39_14920 [Bacteroidetes bacterium]|nr:hypothetical protein [Bacteroidota bacterium]